MLFLNILFKLFLLFLSYIFLSYTYLFIFYYFLSYMFLFVFYPINNNYIFSYLVVYFYCLIQGIFRSNLSPNTSPPTHTYTFCVFFFFSFSWFYKCFFVNILFKLFLLFLSYIVSSYTYLFIFYYFLSYIMFLLVFYPINNNYIFLYLVVYFYCHIQGILMIFMCYKTIELEVRQILQYNYMYNCIKLEGERLGGK